MKKLFREWGLTMVLLLLFAASLIGQALTGFSSFNEERVKHGVRAITSLSDYIRNGHFLSRLTENWESEFLQMALFVYLTSFLYQKGSAESKPPPGEETPEELKDEQ